MIYFDNAATSFPKPISVEKAISKSIKFYGGNPGRSGHKMSFVISEKIYSVRDKIANFFNTNPENVVFTSNCTHSLNIAIQGLLKEKKTVLTTNLEHNSVTRPISSFKQKKNLKWTEIDVFEKKDDEIVNAFKNALNDNVCLVVCTHASNVTGQIMPIRSIYKLCKKSGVPFVVDAAQTAGLLPLDLEKDADIICVPGHKGLYGPTGTGALILKDTLPPPLLFGGTGNESLSPTMPLIPPERYEAGTVNTSGILGLGAGISFVESHGVQNMFSHEQSLCNHVIKNLSMYPQITIYQNPVANYVPVVLFNFNGISSSAGTQLLSDKGFALRGGLHCAPSAHSALGTLSDGAIRFAPSAFNNMAQVKAFCNAVRQIISNDLK